MTGTTQAPTPEPLVLLDATSMLVRSFYGAPTRKAADGREVAALMALTQMLLKLLGKSKSRTFAVVFDAVGDTFRHALSTDYKAQRKAPPAELADQISRVANLTRALGLATWQVEGFEADDVIATLARVARSEGLPVWCVSPDKDLYQLVDDTPPRLALWRPAKREIIDEAAVQTHIGVPAARAVTYFALVGDSSDNVAGVRGVGPKAAVSIVKRFATLDDVYANLVRMWALPVRGAATLGDKLRDAREAAYLAQQLVRLRDDVPLDLDQPLGALARWRGPRQDADGLFEELGFGNLLKSARRLSV